MPAAPVPAIRQLNGEVVPGHRSPAASARQFLLVVRLLLGVAIGIAHLGLGPAC